MDRWTVRWMTLLVFHDFLSCEVLDYKKSLLVNFLLVVIRLSFHFYAFHAPSCFYFTLESCGKDKTLLMMMKMMFRKTHTPLNDRDSIAALNILFPNKTLQHTHTLWHTHLLNHTNRRRIKAKSLLNDSFNLQKIYAFNFVLNFFFTSSNGIYIYMCMC